MDIKLSIDISNLLFSPYCLRTVLVFDTPSKSPWIGAAEREYILSSAEDSMTAAFPTPWRAMLTSRAFWAIMATHVTQVNNVNINWLTMILLPLPRPCPSRTSATTCS